MDHSVHCSSTELFACYTHCNPVDSANTAIQRARRALQVAFKNLEPNCLSMGGGGLKKWG